eukprot:TRINITY_DN11992_c0_g1_i1.p1 TRINITY_DN11992_c0_g1~~TRINITY_DN11992_c0_g1_i1.p1  ORF type:complete len:529 (-),score=110.85 TRINITY_DN11992_c0_g1_i1:192-1778(-)
MEQAQEALVEMPVVEAAAVEARSPTVSAADTVPAQETTSIEAGQPVAETAAVEAIAPTSVAASTEPAQIAMATEAVASAVPVAETVAVEAIAPTSAATSAEPAQDGMATEAMLASEEPSCDGSSETVASVCDATIGASATVPELRATDKTQATAGTVVTRTATSSNTAVGGSRRPSEDSGPEFHDVAKSDGVLTHAQALPGYVAHTVGSIVGGMTLTAGWALGKAEEKLGKTKQAADSKAFKVGFETWLYANGIWPKVLCERGPYGNDFAPMPNDRKARKKLLRATPLLVSNHVSYLDTVVLPLALEVPKMMAMREVQTYPLIGQLCQELEMIWVDRSNPASRSAAKQAIGNHVANWQDGDRPLLIFPEGGTSNGRTMKEFKHGSFAFGAAVRPVVLLYTGEWDPSNVNFREAVDKKAAENANGGGGSPSGTTKMEGYGDREWAHQFMGHFIHSCTVLICRPYHPTAAEKADPDLYKTNVRKLMLERLEELRAHEERRRQSKERIVAPNLLTGVDGWFRSASARMGLA